MCLAGKTAMAQKSQWYTCFYACNWDIVILSVILIIERSSHSNNFAKALIRTENTNHEKNI